MSRVEKDENSSVKRSINSVPADMKAPNALRKWSYAKTVHDDVVEVLRKTLPDNILIEVVGTLTATTEQPSSAVVYVMDRKKNKCAQLKFKRVRSETEWILHVDTLKFSHDEKECTLGGTDVMAWITGPLRRAMSFKRMELEDAATLIPEDDEGAKQDLEGMEDADTVTGRVLRIPLTLFRKFLTGTGWYEGYGFLPKGSHRQLLYRESFAHMRSTPAGDVAFFLWTVVRMHLYKTKQGHVKFDPRAIRWHRDPVRPKYAKNRVFALDTLEEEHIEHHTAIIAAAAEQLVHIQFAGQVDAHLRRVRELFVNQYVNEYDDDGNEEEISIPKHPYRRITLIRRLLERIGLPANARDRFVDADPSETKWLDEHVPVMKPSDASKCIVGVLFPPTYHIVTKYMLQPTRAPEPKQSSPTGTRGDMSKALFTDPKRRVPFLKFLREIVAFLLTMTQLGALVRYGELEYDDSAPKKTNELDIDRELRQVTCRKRYDPDSPATFWVRFGKYHKWDEGPMMLPTLGATRSRTTMHSSEVSMRRRADPAFVLMVKQTKWKPEKSETKKRVLPKPTQRASDDDIDLVNITDSEVVDVMASDTFAIALSISTVMEEWLKKATTKKAIGILVMHDSLVRKMSQKKVRGSKATDSVFLLLYKDQATLQSAIDRRRIFDDKIAHVRIFHIDTGGRAASVHKMERGLKDLLGQYVKQAKN